MKDIILHGLKVIGVKLATSFIAISLMIAFTWLFQLPGGFRIYSVIMSLLMCGWIFSVATTHGRKLYSRNRSPFLGFLCGFIGEIPTLLIIAAIYIFKNSFMYLNVAYCAYNAPYVGIFKADAKILQMTEFSPICILFVLLVPLVYFVGYRMGQKGYEPSGKLVHSLVYKNEGGEEDGKKK